MPTVVADRCLRGQGGVVVEELRITRRTSELEVQQPVTLRKEEVIVNRVSPEGRNPNGSTDR